MPIAVKVVRLSMIASVFISLFCGLIFAARAAARILHFFFRTSSLKLTKKNFFGSVLVLLECRTGLNIEEEVT